jgi:LysR family transcriptional regulator, glycine cleavage system transcriptional activator
MARRLPPLNAVRAFEAAGRHGSFLLAGRELRVTAGAISHQVKTLERFLGVRLFHRLQRGIVLTDAGSNYLAASRDGLDRLATATEQLAVGSRSRILRISALPAFAEKWLVPRLQQFQEQHQDIDVRLAADAEIVDFVTRDYDIGLRYTDGRHAGLKADLLLEEEIFPVCSPSLLQGPRLIRRPSDLSGQTLLYDVHWQDDWRLWLTAAGLADLRPRQESRFTLYSMALEAAIRGGGVLIGHSAMIADDLAAGRLVVPFSERVPAPHAYYLVCPKWAESRHAVQSFRTWLTEAVASFKQAQSAAARGEPPRRPAGTLRRRAKRR